ncbi:DUF4167 domain-containing protein [Aureimonas sp. SK2]|uniref:DUF4167 domain-containing protein n=1 Tax=Aureimonas sp. SK2 TaxID=3015992 RepID=UPI0024445103|nr:DUF4167 domain-containing protein [Aureimonas sp. SK2]
MRPGQQQQNKRMRGRGGRKGPNPMSRSFESNGPDVKIRGTAQHIADKYTTLARDAAAAGDRVMAENYLQHAEHYGRIVAAAMGQFQPSQPERDYSDFDEDGDDEGQGPEMGQPFAGGQERPQNGFNGERHQNGDRPQGGERHGGDRQNFRDGQNPRGERRDNRENRGDRPFGNREGFARDNRDGQNRDDRRERDNRDNRQPGTGPQPFVQGPDLDQEGTAPRQDGGRFEGGRRENRRDRSRFNDRSGERRFEERFGRQRPAGEERDETVAERPDRPTEVAAAGVSEPVSEAPAHAVTPDAPLGIEAEGRASEARGRGRRRRETTEGGEASAPVAAPPAPEAEAPAPLAEPAPAPARRRTPKVAADIAEAPVAAEGEAAPKRRVAKPRRKKDDGEADADRAPALLTTDN